MGQLLATGRYAHTDIPASGRLADTVLESWSIRKSSSRAVLIPSNSTETPYGVVLAASQIFRIIRGQKYDFDRRLAG